MSECNNWLDELKAYADGELAPGRRVALRVHLTRCADCRKELEEMDNVTASLKADEPNGFDASLRTKLLSHAPESAAATPQPIPWRANRKLQLWAAACTVIIVWFAGAAILPMFSQAREGWFSPQASRVASAPQMRAVQEEKKAMSRQEVAMAPEEDMASSSKANGRAMMNEGGPPMAGGGQMGQMGASQPTGEIADYSRNPVQYEAQHKGLPTASLPNRAAASEFADGHAKQISLPERHVVRRADITVEVQKLEEKSDQVERMVKDAGGFVANNQLSTGEENAKSATLSLKVPTSKFDVVLAGIAKLGEVKAKNVTGEDITEKVSDEAAAEKVLASEMTPKDKLLKDPARALELKTRIEQVRGRLELMKKMSALATMTVSLREKPKTAIKSGGFVDEMGDTGRAAVNSFMQAARLPILLLIWVMAYAPVWIPLAIGYRYAAGIHKKRVDERQTREWRERRTAEVG